MASGAVLRAFDMTSEEIRAILDEMVSYKLSDITEFSIQGSKEWSQQIGNDVKEKLKDLSKDSNYKYWVSVVIGELKGQGVEVSSHCAWDASTDNTISCWYANDVLYWFVLVFAAYRAPPKEVEEEAEGEYYNNDNQE